MNFAEMMLKATKDQTMKQVANSISDIYIGTMIGTDSVSLDDGYTVGGDMLLFTQFCYDQVVELPYADAERKSHKHDIHDAINTVMIASPVGLCGAVTDATSIAELTGIQARITAGDPTALAEMAVKCATAAAKTDTFKHKHDEDDALPKIRLWRGVKDGDKVLVMKVNTRHFVVLCRLEGVTNENDEECKGYVNLDT